MADQEYTYKELHETPIRDILTDPEVKPEEKTVEPVVTPPEEAPTLPTADEIAQKTADELQARQAAEAEEAAEELKAQKDEYQAWEDELWDKEKRTPTYQEALKFMQKQAANDPETIKNLRAAIRAEEEAEAKVKADEDAAQAEETKKTDEQLGKIVDDEFMELYRTGVLTKIQDPTNPTDQGLLERQSLAQAWMEVNNKRRAEGKPDILSASRIVHGRDETGKPYWTKPNAQPAGYDAPVMGSKSSAIAPSSENSYTYSDLKKPWSLFGRRS